MSDIAKLYHDREWYLSGDTGLGKWRKSVMEFKAKWFTKTGRDGRFEKYIHKAVKDLRNDLGLNDHKRCETCKSFTPEQDGYGCCPFHRGCLMNNYEVCEEWEQKE